MPCRPRKSGSERLNNMANVSQLVRQLKYKYKTWVLIILLYCLIPAITSFYVLMTVSPQAKFSCIWLADLFSINKKDNTYWHISSVPGTLPSAFVHYFIQLSQEHYEAGYIIIVIQSKKKLSLRVLLRVTEFIIVESSFELKSFYYKA